MSDARRRNGLNVACRSPCRTERDSATCKRDNATKRDKTLPTWDLETHTRRDPDIRSVKLSDISIRVFPSLLGLLFTNTIGRRVRHVTSSAGLQICIKSIQSALTPLCCALQRIDRMLLNRPQTLSEEFTLERSAQKRQYIAASLTQKLQLVTARHWIPTPHCERH